MAVGGETIGRAYIKVLADGNEFEGDLRRILQKAEPTVEKGATDHAKAYDKAHDAQLEKGWKARLARMRARIGLQSREMSALGDKFGKVFGKGSRNDFLNIVGGIVGGVAKALPALGQWVSGINKAGSASAEAAQQMQGAGAGMSRLGQAFGIVGQVAMVGGIIASVTTLLGALGAAASLSAGLVLALAGSLGFALVGAATAALGALVPLAAGLGVFALAIGGLDKKSKAVKDLKESWGDLQKTATKSVFGKDGAGLANLQPILKSLQPLVKGVGGAIGGLLDSLGKAAKGKEFQDMMKGIGDVLPGMVTKIGGIAGKLGIGLGQAFVAAEPLITRFLGFLDDVAGKFVAFSKPDKKGKSGLSDFFDSAMASAEIIGPLILNIIDLVGKLFSAGKGTGDQIFADIAEQVEKIVTWLSSPAGQKALDQWFQDAQKFAGKLGEIVEAVIVFIDTLDSPSSREFLFFLMDGFVRLIGVITTIVGALEFMNGVFLTIGNAVLKIPGLVTSALGTLGAFFSGLWTGITTAVSTAFSEVSAAIMRTITEIGAFLGPAWNFILTGVRQFVTAFIQVFIDLYHEIVGGSIVPDMVRDIVSWFARLPGMIAAVLGDLAGRFQIWLAGVPQKIQSSVGLVAGAFAGLAQKAIARAGNIAAAFAAWVVSLPAKARAMATTVANGFTNLAGKIIAKAGSLASRFASWVSSLAGKARSTVASIVNGFGNLSGKIISKAGSLAAKFASWVAGLPGKAKTIAGQVASAFSGLAGKIIDKAGDLAGKLAGWGRSAVSKAGGVANDIVSKFSGLASKIVNAIGDIVPKIKMPSIKIPTVTAKVVMPNGKAAGGITSGPEIALIGEAGREAIVPLDRALSRVDPAVRALSAFAQGKTMPGQVSAGPSIGRQIDVGGITINTPTTDPRAVASEVVNRMTFAAYI